MMNNFFKKIDSEKLYMCVMFIFLFLFLFFPNGKNFIKLPILGIFTLLSIYCIFKEKIHIDKKYISICIGFVVFIVINFIISSNYGFPIDLKLVEIWIVRPIILLLMIIPFYKKQRKEKLFSFLKIIAVCIIIYDFTYIVSVLAGFSNFFIFNEFFSQSGPVILEETFIAIRMENYTALMFLLPFYNVFFMQGFSFGKMDKKSIFELIIFVLGIIVVLFSGRRAFQILIIATFVIYFIWYGIIARKKIASNKNKILKNFLIIVGIIAIILTFNLFDIRELLYTVFLTIIDAFNVSSHSGSIRAEQLRVLTEAFLTNPIFGTGLASYDLETVRIGYKWSYEFFFNALLMQVGLVGIGLLVSLMIGIFRKVVNLKELTIIMPILIAIFSFMVASATNPMFTSIWFWFIVLAIGYKDVENKN